MSHTAAAPSACTGTGAAEVEVAAAPVNQSFALDIGETASVAVLTGHGVDCSTHAACTDGSGGTIEVRLVDDNARMQVALDCNTYSSIKPPEVTLQA